MGSLLTNIMVDTDLSAVKCLDITCQLRKMFPTHSQYVPNIPLQNEEIGICVWHKRFNGNGIPRVNGV